MPQEVVVPLISVSEVSGKKKQATKVELVGVQLLGDRHKITTPRYRFEFIQTEPVGERRKALTVRLAIYEDDKPVSSVERLVFDSPSNLLDERKRTVKLELVSGQFDRHTPYFLKLYNTDTNDEVLAVPVVIDRSFDDDF